MEEIIKPVPGYEKFYSVSNYGIVFSINYRRKGITQELKQHYRYDKRRKCNTMYKTAKMFHINKNTPTSIHRIVALAFVQNPNNFKQVNHIDGDKSNNRSDNLEWCDNSHNQKHAAMTGLRIHAKGELHCNAILKESDAKNIKLELMAPYHGQLTDLAKRYGVTIHCIYDIKRNRSWKHI